MAFHVDSLACLIAITDRRYHHDRAILRWGEQCCVPYHRIDRLQPFLWLAVHWRKKRHELETFARWNKRKGRMGGW